ncbi:MAG TPA: hypothetical protein VGR35_14805 [Tepidisphaeraceae bacterium]|nr:hypothetical protein [Tepidisphaeraceae bacterium]
MIVGVREFFRTSAGKYAAIGLVVVALGLCAWSIMSNMRGNEAARMSADRVFVCADTGKPFEMELKAGMKIPTRSPHSGKDTGYPAELCYWTADGKIKEDFTAVLLNEQAGRSGPTYCPDCGRLVVRYNPQPTEGSKPPPKKGA